MLGFRVEHVYVMDDETRAEFRRLGRYCRTIIDKMESIMVDTSKLLDAVERAKTESEGLRALVRANNEKLKEIQQKLDDALAAPRLDKAELDRVQQVVDNAVADLSLDDKDVQDLLKANTPQDPNGSQSGSQGDTSGGQSGSSGGSQSSSDASQGSQSGSSGEAGGQPASGGDQTAQPLPGTGVEPPPAQPTDQQQPAQTEQPAPTQPDPNAQNPS